MNFLEAGFHYSEMNVKLKHVVCIHSNVVSHYIEHSKDVTLHVSELQTEITSEDLNLYFTWCGDDSSVKVTMLGEGKAIVNISGLKNEGTLVQLFTYHYPGGKAKRFTAVYNGKRRYAAVKRTRYHSIPHSVLPEYCA